MANLKMIALGAGVIGVGVVGFMYWRGNQAPRAYEPLSGRPFEPAPEKKEEQKAVTEPPKLGGCRLNTSTNLYNYYNEDNSINYGKSCGGNWVKNPDWSEKGSSWGWTKLTA